MAGRWINGRSLGYLIVGIVIGAAAATWVQRRDPPPVVEEAPLENDQTLSSDATELDLDTVLARTQETLDTIDNSVDDYTATLIKQQRIEGTLKPKQRIELKLKQLAPEGDKRRLRVYLHFLEPESVAGREVIWGSDLYDGELYAHEGGLMGLVAVSLDPDSALAMRGQKHPVYRIGIATLAESFLENARELVEATEAQITKTTRLVGDVECENYVIEAQGSTVGVRLVRLEFAIDPERNIPLRYATYSADDDAASKKLEDLYEYHDVKLNVGLQEIDFDSENPEYNYP